MTMIQFVSNYQDLSTDKGYQFKFNCDKCSNGFMSKFQPSYIGMAGGFLNAASNLLGWGHSALQTAIEEGKQHFHQCSRCGKWVCPEVCWNEQANQCEGCAPRFEEEMAAIHAQAKADAMRQQMQEKAQKTDYVSDVDMSANSYATSSQAVKPGAPSVVACLACSYPIPPNVKFCPECGTTTKQEKPKCPSCSAETEYTTKFCPECGNKMI